jgi:hypothetical protein
LEKSFFSELFIPKENTFENSIFDMTVEGNRFLSFPYFFHDNQSQSKKQSKTKKTFEEDVLASASPGSNLEDKPKFFKEEGGSIKIKAMNIIFVLDSYNQDCLSRIDYLSAVL